MSLAFFQSGTHDSLCQREWDEGKLECSRHSGYPLTRDTSALNPMAILAARETPDDETEFECRSRNVEDSAPTIVYSLQSRWSPWRSVQVVRPEIARALRSGEEQVVKVDGAYTAVEYRKRKP